MTNYICINGKKAELTEEQMKALGIELPKASPFNRVEKNKIYYVISGSGIVSTEREDGYDVDTERFEVANYCTDKSIMEQRALHETLNRLLWRYSMEHDGDKIGWNTHQPKYHLFYDHDLKQFRTHENTYHQNLGIYFDTREIAQDAIEEVIKPFMKAHPEFKW